MLKSPFAAVAGLVDALGGFKSATEWPLGLFVDVLGCSSSHFWGPATMGSPWIKPSWLHNSGDENVLQQTPWTRTIHGIQRYPLLHHPHPKTRSRQALIKPYLGLVWDGDGMEGGYLSSL